jgi:murein DD-endopeptidase MepM/ murein hydrolase activator NlpD
VIRVYPLVGVPKTIVGGYGPRTTGGVTKLHDAVDLGAPTGTPVVAVDDGTVSYGSDPMGGNVAVLRTADGNGYYYAHLLDTQSGSRVVKVGDAIARCDTTGNAALVGIPHVHFQVWPGGQFDQGTVHPDPTADLMAAPVLPASAGSGKKVALALLGMVALFGAGIGMGWAWENRDRIFA